MAVFIGTTACTIAARAAGASISTTAAVLGVILRINTLTIAARPRTDSTTAPAILAVAKKVRATAITTLLTSATTFSITLDSAGTLNA